MLQVGDDELHFINYIRKQNPTQTFDFNLAVIALKMSQKKAEEILLSFIREKIVTIKDCTVYLGHLKEYWEKIEEHTSYTQGRLPDDYFFDEDEWLNIEWSKLTKKEQDALSFENELKLEPTRVESLLTNPIFAKHASITFTVDQGILNEKIIEFTNNFAADELNDGETIQYSKLKKDLIYCINKKLDAGLPHKAIKIKEITFWQDAIEKDGGVGRFFKRPLAPTLLTMEQEGLLAIKATNHLIEHDMLVKNIHIGGTLEMYLLEITIAVDETMFSAEKTSNKTPTSCETSHFHFVENILFRDHMNKIIKFSENELGHKFLRIALSSPLGTEFDAGDLEFESTKQMTDTARNLNKKINDNFNIPDYFFIDSDKKTIRRASA